MRRAAESQASDITRACRNASSADGSDEGFHMLRITTDKNPHDLVLRLEGRLEGPWVAVLDQCFRSALTKRRGRRLCVDLNGVTFVDGQGKARLAEMYVRGAELLGDGIEMKAIVAEIRTGRAENGDGKASQVGDHKPVFNLSEQLTELQRLQAELNAVNEELAKAARPLEQLDDLNEEQRQHVAKELRAGLSRWDAVTQRIAQVLGINGENGNDEGGSR
jgi:hypothetical protein